MSDLITILFNSYYRQGRKAWKNGKGLLDNPYGKGTWENNSWENGWKGAGDEECKKIIKKFGGE